MNAPNLKALRCFCGYQAGDADDLFIHLCEMLLPDGDTDRSGIAHAEVVRETPGESLACMCGATASDLAELDAHLRAAFMPAGGIGADGARHAIYTEDFPVGDPPRDGEENLP